MPVQAHRTPLSRLNRSLPRGTASFSLSRELLYAKNSFRLTLMAPHEKLETSVLGPLLYLAACFLIVHVYATFNTLLAMLFKAFPGGARMTYSAFPFIAFAVTWILGAMTYKLIQPKLAPMEAIYLVMYSLVHIPLIVLGFLPLTFLAGERLAYIIFIAELTLACSLSGFIVQVNLPPELEDRRKSFLQSIASFVVQLFLAFLMILFLTDTLNLLPIIR